MAQEAVDETADDDQGLVSKFKPNPAQLSAPPAPEPPPSTTPAPSTAPNPNPSPNP
jgi:hypothetical protein